MYSFACRSPDGRVPYRLLSGSIPHPWSNSKSPLPPAIFSAFRKYRTEKLSQRPGSGTDCQNKTTGSEEGNPSASTPRSLAGSRSSLPGSGDEGWVKIGRLGAKTQLITGFRSSDKLNLWSPRQARGDPFPKPERRKPRSIPCSYRGHRGNPWRLIKVKPPDEFNRSSIEVGDGPGRTRRAGRGRVFRVVPRTDPRSGP